LENARPVLFQYFVPTKAQQVAATRAALQPIDGSDQKIGGARLQGPVPHLAVAHHRHAYDGNVLVAEDAAQAANGLDAIHVRHLVVGENHIDTVLARVLDRLDRLGKRDDLDAVVETPDDLAENETARRLIIDDHDGKRRELGFPGVVDQRK